MIEFSSLAPAHIRDLTDDAPHRQRDLMDEILAEGEPGRFRTLALSCFSPQATARAGTQLALRALVKGGWLADNEVAVAQLPVEAAFTAGIPERWPVYLALGLERVGVPLRRRGAYADDPCLEAAVDAAAVRNV